MLAGLALGTLARGENPCVLRVKASDLQEMDHRNWPTTGYGDAGGFTTTITASTTSDHESVLKVYKDSTVSWSGSEKSMIAVGTAETFDMETADVAWGVSATAMVVHRGTALPTGQRVWLGGPNSAMGASPPLKPDPYTWAAEVNSATADGSGNTCLSLPDAIADWRISTANPDLNREDFTFEMNPGLRFYAAMETDLAPGPGVQHWAAGVLDVTASGGGPTTSTDTARQYPDTYYTFKFKFDNVVDQKAPDPAVSSAYPVKFSYSGNPNTGTCRAIETNTAATARRYFNSSSYQLETGSWMNWDSVPTPGYDAAVLDRTSGGPALRFVLAFQVKGNKWMDLVNAGASDHLEVRIKNVQFHADPGVHTCDTSCPAGFECLYANTATVAAFVKAKLAEKIAELEAAVASLGIGTGRVTLKALEQLPESSPVKAALARAFDLIAEDPQSPFAAQGASVVAHTVHLTDTAAVETETRRRRERSRRDAEDYTAAGCHAATDAEKTDADEDGTDDAETTWYVCPCDATLPADTETDKRLESACFTVGAEDDSGPGPGPGLAIALSVGLGVPAAVAVCVVWSRWAGKPGGGRSEVAAAARLGLGPDNAASRLMGEFL
jgi:hypothetical protein